MLKKRSIKKFGLLGLLGLFLFSLIANSLLLLAGPSVRAQSSGSAGVADIENLTGLDIGFGASQNSLILSLEGDESRQIVFGLQEIGERSLEYEAGLPLFTDYRLASGESKPSNCEILPSVSLQPAETVSYFDIPSVDGYDQFWQLYDLGGRDVEAEIRLPLLNAATANVSDDCLLLEAELTFNSGSAVPMFTLIGDRLGEDGCSGLEIYGRGGDDLNDAGVGWICYENANLLGEARDKFSQIDSPPFARSYVFVENRYDKCGSRLLVDADGIDGGRATLAAEWQDWHDDCEKGQYDRGRNEKKTVALSIANGSSAALPETEAVNQADTGLQQGAPLTGIAASSCEASAWNIGIGWLICQLFRGISNVLELIEREIKNYLTLEPEDYQPQIGQQQGYTFKRAWNNVRNLMTFAIVGTALFMVISTALDMGFFKNYTVKKYLPRLVAGIILMQFSWALGDFFIQAANQIGNLMEAVLYSTLPDARGFGLEDIFGGDMMTFLVGLGGAFALSKTWMLLLPLSVTGAAAFAIGFLFLIARKYMIILLLILGPLGLAFWVLPGNDKAWRFYAKTFMYLLLMYPMIVIVLAAGKIFAYMIVTP